MIRTRRIKAHQNPIKSDGFTLFELVVFILIVAIVFSIGMRRFQEFPGEAERANFLAISAQIRAAVHLRMMKAIAEGSWNELGQLEDSNPMDLMLETPSNYAGAFNLVDEIGMPRRTWYFDTYSGHLVYLVNDTANVFSAQGDGTSTLSSIRFRIVQRFASEDASSPEGLGIDAGTVTGLNDPSLRSSGDGENTEAKSSGSKWQGLVLEEVTPFTWERGGLTLPGIEVPQ